MIDHAAGSGQRPPPPPPLQISLGALQLLDHPLFLTEHSLQRSLRSMAMQLAEVRERQQLQLYAHKIGELVAAVQV